MDRQSLFGHLRRVGQKRKVVRVLLVEGAEAETEQGPLRHHRDRRGVHVLPLPDRALRGAAFVDPQARNLASRRVSRGQPPWRRPPSAAGYRRSPRVVAMVTVVATIAPSQIERVSVNINPSAHSGITAAAVTRAHRRRHDATATAAATAHTYRPTPLTTASRNGPRARSCSPCSVAPTDGSEMKRGKTRAFKPSASNSVVSPRYPPKATNAPKKMSRSLGVRKANGARVNTVKGTANRSSSV